MTSGTAKIPGMGPGHHQKARSWDTQSLNREKDAPPCWLCLEPTRQWRFVYPEQTPGAPTPPAHNTGRQEQRFHAVRETDSDAFASASRGSAEYTLKADRGYRYRLSESPVAQDERIGRKPCFSLIRESLPEVLRRALRLLQRLIQSSYPSSQHKPSVEGDLTRTGGEKR